MTVEVISERLRHARQLLREGNPAESIGEADEILNDPVDEDEHVWALLLRLAGVVAMERTSEFSATVDRAYDAIRQHGDAMAAGYFHALAAFASQSDGSIERCVTHLVRSTRALNSLEAPSRQAAVSWHNLAVVYSYIGFHDHAAQAAARVREVADAAGLKWRLPTIEVRVRLGLSLDHRGDTDGCVRVLRSLLASAQQLPPHDDDLPGIHRIDLPWLGFAAARLRILGHEPQINARRCLAVGGNDAWTADLRHFGRVCLAIADGQPAQARQRLSRATSSAAVLGLAEPTRLKALSYLAEDDHQAAWRADRESFAIQARVHDQLRRLFVDGIATRLDHEDLRRTVAGYNDQVLTDPLTGLPNRRHLQDYVDGMAARGEQGILGVVDLEGFRHINANHGHLSGDTVLQRTAGALMRIMRRGDFVARYGADQFVLVLQGTALEKTAEISRRIGTALSAEDWAALIPGSDPRINIGWAQLATQHDHSGVHGGFSLVDRAVRDARAARDSNRASDDARSG